LQQYEGAFRDNAIDAAVLSELTSDDLKELGVSLVGHRRKAARCDRSVAQRYWSRT
jgi:hypothetical protein